MRVTATKQVQKDSRRIQGNSKTENIIFRLIFFSQVGFYNQYTSKKFIGGPSPGTAFLL